MINALQLLDYRAKCGTEAASNLLLLAGPDGFTGDYDRAMADLEHDMRIEKLAVRLDKVIKDIEPYDYEGSPEQALESLKFSPISLIEDLTGLLEDMV